MPPSSALRLADLRAVHTLAGECRDLGDDPAGWRDRFHAGLARLVAADLVVGGELAGFGTARLRDLGAAEWGWDHGFDRRGWLRALDLLRDNPSYSPVFLTYTGRSGRSGAAFRRPELIGDPGWRRSVEWDEVYRAAGVDHPILCFAPIAAAGDEVAGVVLTRAVGRPDFTARQAAVVREAVAAVASLVGGPLARFAEPSPADLPLRVRRVLRCFLEGDAEKAAGLRLGLTRHTVNQYAKVIYRHFGVGSRAELLARWVRRGWGLKGGWAGEDGH